jgi:hypothetical protein
VANYVKGRCAPLRLNCLLAACSPDDHHRPRQEAEQYNAGDTAPFTVDPCGPDCVHVVQTGKGWELHRQGNIWAESDDRGSASLDEGTLVLTVDSVADGHVVIGLVKNA